MLRTFLPAAAISCFFVSPREPLRRNGCLRPVGRQLPAFSARALPAFVRLTATDGREKLERDRLTASGLLPGSSRTRDAQFFPFFKPRTGAARKRCVSTTST